MTLKRKTQSTRTGRATGSESRSDKVIRWIHDFCFVPEGRDVGKRLKLRDWQAAEIRKIYDNPRGLTRTAILSFGRKNGKTALAALLLLVHLCGPERRSNSQLYSAAMSRDQAAVLFGLAAKIVRMSPDLNDLVTIRDTAKQLFCAEYGTLYRALSADASTAYGLSPVFLVHDELGQVRGPRHELYEALETATSAHENPLSVVISTQAPTDADLLSVLIDDALGGEDPRVCVSLYTAADDADPFSDEAIIQANPAFGDFQNAEEVRGMAENARRMPSREAEFRNLILNQRVEATAPFVTRSVWEANGASPDEWGPMYGGLDLSQTGDLTALVLVSPVKGIFSVRCTFWLPGEGLAERARQDRVPYDLWAQQGHLSTTPGRAVEYEYVAGEIVRMFKEHDIRKIAFDRFNMRHLRPWLVKAGLSEAFIDDRFKDFGQGFVSMSPALRALEEQLLNNRLRHGMHPVLTSCLANAVVKSDEAGNRKFDKKRSTGRIDGAVSLAMAMAAACEDMTHGNAFADISLESILEGA